MTTVAPYICVHGAAAAIDFYKSAFGAEEVKRLPVPTGEIGHAEIRIGGAALFLADEYPPQNWVSPHSLDGKSSAQLVLAVDDCEAAIERAVTAGAKVIREITDGEAGRGGWIEDPFGHRWNIKDAG